MTNATEGSPRRIHVLGTSGTGKTTLGTRLAQILNVPIHHLDDIAHVGGGRGPLRPDADRQYWIAEIIAEPRWVTEGIHLGWSDALLVHADLIIWLDHVPPSLAQRRIVSRFLRDAFAEARGRRGRERFLRLRDYASELRGLVSHLRTVGSDDAARAGLNSSDETRIAMETALEPYRDKVMHCTHPDDVEALLNRLGHESGTVWMPG